MAGDARRDPARVLDTLREETMRRAWGDRSPLERRRIALAALLFGEHFERRQRLLGAAPDETLVQGALVGLMAAVVRDFAQQEEIGEEEAADFLAEMQTRDLVFELDEALDNARSSGAPLDETLREAVEDRHQRAVWSGHWSSG